MTQIESTTASPEVRNESRWHGRAAVAVASGVLGTVAAVWAYWLLVPGLALGMIAVVLGALSYRRGAREAGSAAIALGIVAVLLVPSVLFVVGEAEDWGRDCALNPTNPDC